MGRTDRKQNRTSTGERAARFFMAQLTKMRNMFQMTTQNIPNEINYTKWNQLYPQLPYQSRWGFLA
jgi:hypothetical protein